MFSVTYDNFYLRLVAIRNAREGGLAARGTENSWLTLDAAISGDAFMARTLE
jgi:hypothetical protein